MRVSSLIRNAALLFMAPSLAVAQPVMNVQDVIIGKHKEIDLCLKSDESVDKVREQIVTLTDTFIDFDELARLTIKSYWDELKPDKQKEFVELFKHIIQRNYSKRFKPTKELKSFVSTDVEVREGRARVPTLLTIEKVEVSVEYRLHQPLDKKGWWVYDIIIDEVSLMRNYRSQFHKIIKKNNGVEAIFITLKEVQDERG